MARTRSIRPGFFTNEDLCSLPPLTRLLFAGLWTLADREGRLLDQPAKIKAALFPYERRLSVERALAELAAKKLVLRYSSCGLRLVFVQSWYRHQHPHPREEASKLPPPELKNEKLGAPQGMTLGAPPARLSSSSSSSSSLNSLRELTPNPSADALGGETPSPRANGTNPRARGTNPRARGRNPRAVGSNPRSRRGVAFEDDGPRYVQQIGADGKREWVEVEA